jgi:RHS repeat-associated protein
MCSNPSFFYNPSNLQIDPATLALDTETVSYDLDHDGTADFTRVLDRSQDSLGRHTGWTLQGSAGVPPASFTEAQATDTYSATTGRLATVANGSQTFSYGYVPDSNLLHTVTGPVHTVTNTWEADRNVLDKKENEVGTTLVSSYDYFVNPIGQRTSVSKSGTAFGSSRDITWGYDNLGQITKAESTIPGLDRAYQFVLIGNRLKTAESLTLPTSNNYTPNALNQYTSVTEGSAGVSPAYDSDGNMTSGPLPIDPESASSLTWDAENRLISATVDSTTVTVTYAYDAQSRRIATTVGTYTTLFVYDGWNPIAEWSADLQSASLTKTYTWGIDLSGSLQGAGGVGGLLAVAIHDQQSSIYYPTFDGNGNVSEYLDSNGGVVAHYEYDPFGRITVATGSKAQDFAHRFSTKPLDVTTGLYYYGYRWYDPATGRWPSRDPIEEQGGINLYGFVGNNGVNRWDLLGLDFIAAARTEVNWFGINLGMHAIIQYWTSCFKLPKDSVNGAWTTFETLVVSMPDLTQKHSAEVGPDGKYASKAKWKDRGGLLGPGGHIGGPVVISHSEQFNALTLSVVFYDTAKQAEMVPVFEGNDAEVSDKWEKISMEAKSYRWAEQEKGVTTNFPQSIYGDPTYSHNTLVNSDQSPIPFNNSNTFARYLLNQAAISWESIPTNDFPGLSLPEDVIGNWTTPIAK